MTIAEAKATIYANVVYACEKAGFAPQTTRLVQDACDTIIALADRNTENCSENPNNCKTCRHYTLACDLFSEICRYEPKTEPQNKYPTEWCEKCELWREDNCIGVAQCKRNNEAFKDEPQKIGYCNECKWFRDKQVCGRCRSKNLYAPKDEPQTDDEYINNLPWTEAGNGEQTDIEIARAIVHKLIDDAVIAEDVYPDLRQKMHDAVDAYEPQTERNE